MHLWTRPSFISFTHCASQAGFDVDLEAADAESEVVEAANFKDHQFTKTVHSDFVDKGYYVGRQVYIKKRITIVVDEKAKYRKDIVSGQQGIIKGVANDQLVVTFELTTKAGDTIRKDVALTMDNIDLSKPTDPEGTDTAAVPPLPLQLRRGLSTWLKWLLKVCRSSTSGRTC